MIYYESSYTGVTPLDGDYLMHFGTKGQKKGVRRWQNEDGSYTAAGAANGGRYGYDPSDYKAAKREHKLAKYKTKENKKLDRRYDKKISRLEKKSEKLGAKYEKTAAKYESGPDMISAKKHFRQERKLNKIADKYEKTVTNKHERQNSKAAEKERIDNSTYRQMKSDRRRVRRKAIGGYLGAGIVGGGAVGLAWQGARRGKYKEKVRISKSSRRSIDRSSAAQAAMDRARLEKTKIKRRR